MNDTTGHIHTAVTTGDYDTLVDSVPYAVFLGLQIELAPDRQARLYRLPFRDALIGNHCKPALHGGTVAGLLELAMQFEVRIAEDQQRLPYPVDFSSITGARQPTGTVLPADPFGAVCGPGASRVRAGRSRQADRIRAGGLPVAPGGRQERLSARPRLSEQLRAID